jgi:CCR4-NOT complex subunit CAF16
MNYLKKESIEKKACIIYITHIFDGLDEWCSHLMYMNRNGNIDYFGEKPNESIYNYLLNKMKQEDYDFIEEEENKDYANRKNAGGYSDGVLIDYNIDRK